MEPKPVDPTLRRMKLLLILSAMPEEAWGWVVLAFLKPQGQVSIFQQGLGGFTDESERAIVALQDAAVEYMSENPT